MSSHRTQSFAESAVKTPTPRTILVEDTNKNTTGATRFGPMMVLYPQGDYRPSVWDDDIRDNVSTRLDMIGYDPGIDYLIISGSQVMMSIVVSVAAAKYGSFKALVFNAHDDIRDYQSITLGHCKGHCDE